MVGTVYGSVNALIDCRGIVLARDALSDPLFEGCYWPSLWMVGLIQSRDATKDLFVVDGNENTQTSQHFAAQPRKTTDTATVDYLPMIQS